MKTRRASWSGRPRIKLGVTAPAASAAREPPCQCRSGTGALADWGQLQTLMPGAMSATARFVSNLPF